MIATDNSPARAVVDDHSLALRDHRGQRKLGHQERAFQVDVNLLVPLAFGTLDGGLRIEDTGVVEEDIEPSEGAERLVHSATAVVGNGYIGVDEDGFAIVLLDPIDHALAALLVSAGDGDLGSFLGEE